MRGNVVDMADIMKGFDSAQKGGPDKSTAASRFKEALAISTEKSGKQRLPRRRLFRESGDRHQTVSRSRPVCDQQGIGRPFLDGWPGGKEDQNRPRSEGNGLAQDRFGK